MTRFPIYVSPT